MADANVRVNVEANAAGAERGFARASAAVDAYSRRLSRAERSERSYNAMQSRAAAEMAADFAKRRAAVLAFAESAGRGMALFGAATAVGLGVAAKAAMDWESAFAGVAKTVDNVNLDVLDQQLRDLANTLPATHDQIAAVAEAAGQLGVRGEDLVEFTETAIRLGVSTNLAAEDAATGLAKLGSIMGVATSEVDRAGAALVRLGNNGASTEADILEMATRIAGAARQVGMSEADVLAFANALSSVGIEAEAGGTAISRVFLTIEQATRNGGKALDEFARISGMSAQEYRQAFEQDAAQATRAFIAGLGRVQAAGGDVTGVLDRLGLSEIRVADTLRRTSAASDALGESLAMSREEWESTSALVEESSKRFETAESRIALARNQLTNAAIDIGGAVLPAFADLASNVGTLAEMFAELPGPVKDSLGKLGAAVGVLSLVGGAALIAVPKLIAFRDALDGMGSKGKAAASAMGRFGSVLAGPWGLALAAGTTALAIWTAKQVEARQRVSALAGTLDEQTGAVTANTREWVVNRLAEEDAFRAARTLGISQKDLADAMLGQADAQARVNAAIEASEPAMRTQILGLTESESAAKKLSGLLGTQEGDLAKAAQAAKDHAAAMGESADSAESAADSAGEAAREYDSLGKQVGMTTEQIDEMARALDDAAGRFLGSREAARQYQEAVVEASEALAANGKGLSLNTEKGRENARALDRLAEAALDQADAILRETGSEAEFRKSLAASRTSLIETATRFGMTGAQAKAYADKVLGIPDVAITDVALNGVDSAIGRIQTYYGWLARVDGYTVNTYVKQNGNVSGIKPPAGVIGRGATGGLIPGPPSAVDNRLYHVATGEYIVNAAATSRNLALLEAINSGRQVEVKHYAQGGYVTPASSSASSPARGGDVINVYGSDAYNAWQKAEVMRERMAAVSAWRG